ncbi:uncharacterized protein LOC109847563 [Asparagus officinalis]|uniref:uncharacterized protein LOC109847563 n=1 Tax=Asparagus officinalis TaxID=4686 RepID=UPI00098E8208|nr:uncharacterized protein LOC109847563 [Asparagus officinalis]
MRRPAQRSVVVSSPSALTSPCLAITSPSSSRKTEIAELKRRRPPSASGRPSPSALTLDIPSPLPSPPPSSPAPEIFKPAIDGFEAESYTVVVDAVLRDYIFRHLTNNHDKFNLLIMWREIRLLAASKPVIASMSVVAASGGCYMAMVAQTIVAKKLTLTASIGVVTGKPRLILCDDYSSHVFQGGEALVEVGNWCGCGYEYCGDW